MIADCITKIRWIGMYYKKQVMVIGGVQSYWKMLVLQQYLFYYY